MHEPYDPRCKRTPSEIDEYITAAFENEMDVNDYVIAYEGTYNPKNGHFACTQCYIEMGMPTTPYGWKMP